VITSVSLIGASGRMGQLTLGLIEKDPSLTLHSALGSGNSLNEALGADLLLDFTNPEVSERVVDFAIENNLRLIVGTSGWSKEKIDRVRAKISGTSAVIVIVPNFSIGSVLATKFAAEASKYFDGIEIIETHNVTKVDAPSGTALYTSLAISEARDGKPANEQTGETKDPLFNGIPIKSVRLPDKHAEQEVTLTAPDEFLYVRHEVTSHEVYAKGILISIHKAMKASGLSVGMLSLMDEN
jgi:4-hydroxy-tetrahydrodipicolinate reductase